MRISMLAVALTAGLIGPVFAGEENSSEGAKTDNSVTVSTVFGRYGFSSSPHLTASSCSVELELNQKTFIDNIDELKQMRLMNREISQTMINSKPNFLSMAFGVEMLPVATKEWTPIVANSYCRCPPSMIMATTKEY